MEQVKRILDFLALSERLKFELRHSWLSSGRQESVAEHSWQMALMALLIHRHLEQPVDIAKTLKMILVHDLVEAEVGDVPFFETGERKRLKAAREQMAIEKIRGALDPATGQEIYDLWQEYEAKVTAEARFATALDHLEVQVQHNLADFATWEPIEYDLVYTKMDAPCAVDPFLAAFCKAVKEQAESKMQAGGIEPAAVRRPARRDGRPGIAAADLTGRSGCAAGACESRWPALAGLGYPWAEGQENRETPTHETFAHGRGSGIRHCGPSGGRRLQAGRHLRYRRQVRQVLQRGGL